MLTSGARAQFLFVSSNNVITISGYAGSNGAVVVPKKINGLPVATIGTSAFASLTNLTSVTLPDTVVTISSLAFTNCTGLTNIILGNGVTAIGNYAFEYCSNLSTVTIPAGIRSLGNYAFAYCANLAGIYFQGNAITVLGTPFFSDSHAVVYYFPWTTGWGQTFANVPTASYLPPVPFNYTTSNSAITITGYTGSNGVAILPSTIYVPSATNFLPVTAIGDYAFAGSPGLSNIFIPGSITNFWFAFAGCSNLTGVFFAGNDPYTSRAAVFDDRNFSVYYEPGTSGWSSFFAYVPAVPLPYNYIITNGTIVVTSYGGSGGAFAIPDALGGLPVTSIGDGAFASCGNLTSVTIPDTITDIGNGAFAFCGGLTNITLPDSVTDFGIFTFYACSNLAAATLSTNIQNIGVSAFDSCASLTNVNIPDGVFIIGGSAFQNCASLGSVTFPSVLTTIGGSAFQNCSSLASVAIPASVKDIGVSPGRVVSGIGWDAFGACASLQTITVDPQNTNYSSLDGVLLNLNQTTLIQYPAGKTGNYNIPSSVSYVGNFAFDSCMRLTSVFISNNNVLIGDWAFSGCSMLTNFFFANYLSGVGAYAFETCSALGSVSFATLSTSDLVGYHAFDGCTNLSNVTIWNYAFGYNLFDGSSFFSDCPNLTSVYLSSAHPSFIWNPTNQIAPPTVYYLPGASLTYVSNVPTAFWLPTIYRAATRTSAFRQINSDLTSVGPAAHGLTLTPAQTWPIPFGRRWAPSSSTATQFISAIHNGPIIPPVFTASAAIFPHNK